MKLIKLLLAIWVLFWGGGVATTYAAGLANSAWPVFHGDSKLTGQSEYDTSKIKGGIKWTFQAEGQNETSPVIDAEGNIYIVDQKCNLYSITPEGKERWKFKAGDPVISKEWGGFGSCSQSTPAIDAEGTVYFLPMSGNFYAVDKNGKEKWRYPVFTFKNAWPSPAVGPDGTIYVGSELYPPMETGKPTEKNAQFYAFNPDGTLKWSYEPKGSSWVNSTPAIADDGTIYTTANDCKQNCDNGIFAINPNGTLKWTFLPPNGVLEGSPVIGSDGTIYFTAKGKNDPRDANFYAITSEGKEKWKFPLPNGASITPGLSKDGKLFFGDWGGIFYALDLNGKELWRVQTPTAFESLSSSPAIGADGTVYFGTIAEYFYAYTPDGKEKWKISTDKGGVVSSPAIGADGTVYFATVAGRLYAIGEGNANTAAGDDSATNQKTNIFNYIAIAILGTLILLCIIFIIISIKRRTFSQLKMIITGLILIGLIAGFGYKIYRSINKTTNNQTSSQSVNEQAKTFEEVKGTCPRRVYGSKDTSYYGIYAMQQIDIPNEELTWIRVNCPDTYIVGEGQTGQPIGNQ